MTGLNWDTARRRQANRLHGDTPWKKLIHLRTAGQCHICLRGMNPGQPAYWNTDSRQLRHPACHNNNTL